MKYIEAQREAEKLLLESGIEEAAIDATYLMLHVTGMSSSKLLLERTEIMPQDMLERYFELTKRRTKREPLQYILGTQEFMGLEFRVTPAVLIPRQDTEVLVELALKKCAGKRVLDMCTGSGCIAVSVAKLGKPERVDACDISADALAVAEENARLNGVLVGFIEGDLFSDISGRYDLILSNPPYIVTKEIDTLMPEVAVHEPVIALDGGADGLNFYRRIVAESPDCLAAGGSLIVEIGAEQGKAVSELFAAHGFTDVEVCRDLAGLDRVVCGKYAGI